MKLSHDDIQKEQIIEVIAKHLEKISREDDAEHKKFPALGRIPYDEQTYVGWMHSARTLYNKISAYIVGSYEKV
ncbi:MAG: hypothetical protein KAV87_64375 [Desulfobacteraceae bacterium]|nr:hypothetical protein [Desulfobacteraceae bacterium]